MSLRRKIALWLCHDLVVRNDAEQLSADSAARVHLEKDAAAHLGMLGQPFWFYASWQTEQWSIFAVSALYALAWMKGIWIHWIKPGRAREASAIGTIQFAPEARK